ncbi:hypothetical protein CLAIMM_06900 isoform 3 [Cladophialophora immunda]|nr:hypothetical protein CLAIMM_06900 isoform 3 [Cladophialophora immunda]
MHPVQIGAWLAGWLGFRRRKHIGVALRHGTEQTKGRGDNLRHGAIVWSSDMGKLTKSAIELQADDDNGLRGKPKEKKKTVKFSLDGKTPSGQSWRKRLDRSRAYPRGR